MCLAHILVNVDRLQHTGVRSVDIWRSDSLHCHSESYRSMFHGPHWIIVFDSHLDKPCDGFALAIRVTKKWPKPEKWWHQHFHSSQQIYTVKSLRIAAVSWGVRIICLLAPLGQGNMGNMLLSPLSIYNAFIMTMAGADGLTKQEMMDTLRVPKHLRGDNAHRAFGSVFKTYFEPSPGVDVSLGNRIFLLQFVNLSDTFRQVVQKCYNADTEVVRLEFGLYNSLLPAL